MNSSLTLKKWLQAIGYVLFIYATLSVVRAPVQYLRAHNMLRLSLYSLYLACFLLLTFVFWRQRRQFGIRWVGLTGFFVLYGVFAARIVTIPEEQIHFLEYGLVGALFSRALEAGHQKNKAAVFFQAWGLAILAGLIDELLQGLLPNRHYDRRDILLNAVSALMGLFIYRLYLKGKSELRADPQLINPSK